MKTRTSLIIIIMAALAMSTQAQELTHFKIDQKYVWEFTTTEGSDHGQLYDQYYGGKMTTELTWDENTRLVRDEAADYPRLVVQYPTRLTAISGPTEFELKNFRAEAREGLHRLSFELKADADEVVTVDLYALIDGEKTLIERFERFADDWSTGSTEVDATENTSYTLEVNTAKRGLRYTLGSDLEYESTLEIFPNPSTAHATARVPVSDIGGELYIYSVSGQHIGTLPITGSEVDINCASWSPGSYMMKCSATGASSTMIRQ